MRLVTFSHNGKERLGALIDGDRRVVDLLASTGGTEPAFASMQDLIEAGDAGLAKARAIVDQPGSAVILDSNEVQLCAPLPRPVKLRDCQIYLNHVKDGMENMARELAKDSEDPEAEYQRLMATGKYSVNPAALRRIIYYNCDCTSVVGPGATIVWPAESDWIDYEIEMGIIVGKAGRDIPESQAREHIFGYTIFNDLSARDVQMDVMAAQLGPGAGKDFDGSNVLGPCIVTADEIDDVYALATAVRINGETWSTSTTAGPNHSFERTVALLSKDRTLRAGEIIGTGSFAGGCGFELGKRLNRGDKVELEIESLGILDCTIAA